MEGPLPYPHRASFSTAFLWGGPRCHHPKATYLEPTRANSAKLSAQGVSSPPALSRDVPLACTGRARVQASHPPLDAQGPPTTIEAVPASPERAAVVPSVNIHPPGAVKHGSVLITGLFFRKSGAEAQHLCLQEAWALGSPVEATGVLLGNRKFLTQPACLSQQGTPQRTRGQNEGHFASEISPVSNESSCLS